jgi:flagellar basal body-associated protein FliL
MNPAFLETVPILIIFAFITIFMLAFCEVGFRFGAHARESRDKEATVSLGPMVGGLMGMLAFVLAITFSIAASQHELRKQNVIDEANAVGTAYQRADLLAEPVASEVKKLLREYVDIRLQAANGGDLNAILARSVEIHGLLWSRVSDPRQYLAGSTHDLCTLDDDHGDTGRTDR